MIEENRIRNLKNAYRDRLKPSKAARTSENGNVTTNKIHDIRLIRKLWKENKHTPLMDPTFLYPARAVPRYRW